MNVLLSITLFISSFFVQHPGKELSLCEWNDIVYTNYMNLVIIPNGELNTWINKNELRFNDNLELFIKEAPAKFNLLLQSESKFYNFINLLESTPETIELTEYILLYSDAKLQGLNLYLQAFRLLDENLIESANDKFNEAIFYFDQINTNIKNLNDYCKNKIKLKEYIIADDTLKS